MITEALFCLALNAYWEARDQDMKGMLAVSQVVMNRVESEHYPNTPCEVIYQGPTRPSWKDPSVRYPVKNRCQFSWYCDGKKDTPKENFAWQQAFLAASGVYYKQVDNLVGDSLWYHADYVKPGWARAKKKVTKIGDHIFYSWKK